MRFVHGGVKHVVLHITKGWHDTLLADVVAGALKAYCKAVSSAELDGGTLTVLSADDEWYIAVVESSDYTDIYACKDLGTLSSFLVEEYGISEEYDREAYRMLSKFL